MASAPGHRAMIACATRWQKSGRRDRAFTTGHTAMTIVCARASRPPGFAVNRIKLGSTKPATATLAGPRSTVGNETAWAYRRRLCGGNVRVHAEQVHGIIRCLQLAQPGIVLAIRGANPLRTVVSHHVVDVDSAEQFGLESIP